MTKEELREHCEKQVKMCEEWAKGNDREPSGKTYEEHKLILELLDQQPNDDCISRTQAIEWIENLRQIDKCFGNYKDDYFPLSEVIDRLKNVPPVTPTQRWILVSEMLPKESDGAVLITVNGEVNTGRYSEFSNTWYKGDLRGVGGDDPIAWQPLPQPYEEKRGNEE